MQIRISDADTCVVCTWAFCVGKPGFAVLFVYKISSFVIGLASICITGFFSLFRPHFSIVKSAHFYFSLFFSFFPVNCKSIWAILGRSTEFFSDDYLLIESYMYVVLSHSLCVGDLVCLVVSLLAKTRGLK